MKDLLEKVLNLDLIPKDGKRNGYMCLIRYI